MFWRAVHFDSFQQRKVMTAKKMTTIPMQIAFSVAERGSHSPEHLDSVV